MSMDADDAVAGFVSTRKRMVELDRLAKEVVRARQLHANECFCHPDNECFTECQAEGREAFVDALRNLETFLKGEGR